MMIFELILNYLSQNGTSSSRSKLIVGSLRQTLHTKKPIGSMFCYACNHDMNTLTYYNIILTQVRTFVVRQYDDSNIIHYEQ